MTDEKRDFEKEVLTPKATVEREYTDDFNGCYHTEDYYRDEWVEDLLKAWKDQKDEIDRLRKELEEKDFQSPGEHLVTIKEYEALRARVKELEDAEKNAKEHGWRND